jgi:hypothetical protein
MPVKPFTDATDGEGIVVEDSACDVLGTPVHPLPGRGDHQPVSSTRRSLADVVIASVSAVVY